MWNQFEIRYCEKSSDCWRSMVWNNLIAQQSFSEPRIISCHMLMNFHSLWLLLVGITEQNKVRGEKKDVEVRIKKSKAQRFILNLLTYMCENEIQMSGKMRLFAKLLSFQLDAESSRLDSCLTCRVYAVHVLEPYRLDNSKEWSEVHDKSQIYSENFISCNLVKYIFLTLICYSWLFSPSKWA